MAAKVALILVAAFVLFQFLSTDASIVRRDAPTTPKSDLDDAINSAKQTIEDWVKTVQTNEMFQNASKLLDDFGKKVKQQTEELVQKIKTTNDAKTN